MKRIIFVLLSVFFMTSTSVFAQRYTFSSVCGTGQTLYYEVYDWDNHFVQLVAPNGWNTDAYTGYTMPTGIVLIPTTVSYNNVSYTVKQITNDAFWGCIDLATPIKSRT